MFLKHGFALILFFFSFNALAASTIPATLGKSYYIYDAPYTSGSNFFPDDPSTSPYFDETSLCTAYAAARGFEFVSFNGECVLRKNGSLDFRPVSSSDVYTCPKGYYLAGSQCVDPCPNSGENLHSGYYDGGAANSFNYKNFPSIICDGGCLYSFTDTGNGLFASMNDGVNHTYLQGSFDSLGVNVGGDTGSCPADTNDNNFDVLQSVPPSGCGANQVSITGTDGKLRCYNNDGSPVDDYERVSVLPNYEYNNEQLLESAQEVGAQAAAAVAEAGGSATEQIQARNNAITVFLAQQASNQTSPSPTFCQQNPMALACTGYGIDKSAKEETQKAILQVLKDIQANGMGGGGDGGGGDGGGSDPQPNPISEYCAANPTAGICQNTDTTQNDIEEFCTANPNAQMCKEAPPETTFTNSGLGAPDATQNWYERKYPDGIQGVIAARMPEITNTPLGQLIEGFAFNINAAPFSGCFNFNLNTGILDFGNQSLCIPSLIFDFVRILIYLGALLLARKLIFGG